MNIQKYVFTSIEIVGCIVVLLVWLAITTMPYAYPDKMIPVVIWSLLPVATLVMLLTISRSWTQISRKALFVLGLVLLIMGAAVAYLIPEYFYWAVELDVYYWLKVSAYTLPAICTEGAIFTLCIAFVEQGVGQRTPRERFLLALCFVIYATLTVAVNFMVLNGTLSVAGHILFSRVVSAFIVLLAFGILTSNFLQEKRIQ